MFRLLLIFIFSFIYTQVALGQSQPSKYSYYVLDGTCCGGEDSDPHAVFGIEASDGYILLGKSIDKGGLENAFAVKLSKRLPSNTSSDYGKPFSDVFKEYKYDFYKIDKMLFSPAKVIVSSIKTGKTYVSGSINLPLLNDSFNK